MSALPILFIDMLEYILQFFASAITEGSIWKKERIPQPDRKIVNNKNLKKYQNRKGIHAREIGGA